MAPITKNSIHINATSYKGVTPIEKNVIVVDEQGNEYEATYPKRAKGLVKNGRARFVGENKICLACPPDEYLEDNNMEENISVAEVEQNNKLTVEYILEQIEKIFADNGHIYEALAKLDGVQSGEKGALSAQAKAQGIADVVNCRETTNQQLIGFYERMYNDLKNEKANAEIDPTWRTQFLDFVTATSVNAAPGTLVLPDYGKIWNTVFLGKDTAE